MQLGEVVGSSLMQRAVNTHGPPSLFLFFLDFDDLTTFVMTAAGANSVRKSHLATVWTGNQVVTFQSVVRTPAIAPARRMFPFWLWWHGFTPLSAPTLEHPGIPWRPGRKAICSK
jgi:hypothetical protein